MICVSPRCPQPNASALAILNDFKHLGDKWRQAMGTAARFWLLSLNLASSWNRSISSRTEARQAAAKRAETASVSPRCPHE